jgi:hypothetical protein
MDRILKVICIEFLVLSTAAEQLIVSALLDYSAMGQHNDAVRFADG